MSFVRVFTLLSAALAIAQAAQQGNGSSPFMLITSWKPDSIYRFELESHTYVTIPVRGVHYPRSIDYDATEDRIYWTSIFWTGEKITDSEIYSSYLNGTDLKIIRGLGQKSYVSGIAVDPFTRQLFYTDDFLDHIAFLNLTTLNTSVIVNTNLDEPRAIVLDTSKRVLYWTDWGYIGKIEKANFDGSNRTLLIRTDSPCGLALDIKNSHLYWTVYGTNVDVGVISASRVERSNLEGGDRKIIYAKELSAFYGLGLVGNHLYLTDWTSAKYQTTLSHLIRLKTDGTEVTKILSVAGRMNDIYIFQGTPSIHESGPFLTIGVSIGGTAAFIIIVVINIIIVIKIRRYSKYDHPHYKKGKRASSVYNEFCHSREVFTGDVNQDFAVYSEIKDVDNLLNGNHWQSSARPIPTLPPRDVFNPHDYMQPVNSSPDFVYRDNSNQGDYLHPSKSSQDFGHLHTADQCYYLHPSKSSKDFGHLHTPDQSDYLHPSKSSQDFGHLRTADQSDYLHPVKSSKDFDHSSTSNQCDYLHPVKSSKDFDHSSTSNQCDYLHPVKLSQDFGYT